jgi:hypothetical protein
MAGWRMEVRVDARDHLGQFLAKTHLAAIRTVEETARRSADYARSREPVKTGALRASTQPVVLGSTTGGVVFGTNHWKYQDRGTHPHEITADVTFWWERQGRQWRPSGRMSNQMIHHPGNRAVHFISQTQDYATREFMDAARRNFA